MTCICGGSIIEVESYMLVCESCGTINSMTKFVDDILFNNSYKYIDKCYKCVVHFKKYLKCIQDKSNSIVNDSILKMILNDIENGKAKDARESLKNHKMFSYYIHLPQIENRLFGTKPLNISYDNEKKLIDLFQKAEKQLRRLNKIENKKRKQILRFKPILKRLLIKIGLNEIADKIPELKSQAKRDEFNYYWSKVVF